MPAERGFAGRWGQGPMAVARLPRDDHAMDLRDGKSAVLCGVDGSPVATAAATLASKLAARLVAPLVLVHVVADDAVDAHERILREALARVASASVQIRARVEHGDVTTALLHAVDDEQAQLLVVGSRDRGRLARAVLGSVSAAVAARARCPVCVVPPAADDGPAGCDIDGPLLCCIDGSDGAVAAARYAGELAGRLGTEVRLAHVLPDGGKAAVPSADVTPVTFELTLEHEERRALRMLDRVRRAAGVSADARLSLARGEPAEGLHALAAHERAGLVVVASRGRGALKSALLGSVSAKLAATGDRPVVVLSPCDTADGGAPR